MIERICIVRLSALGDAIMLVPLVRTLQGHFPGVEITWVISEPAYSMLKGLSGVRFEVIQKPKTPMDYWRLRQLFKTREFDVLLATQASMRANLIYPFIRAARKIGYDKARANDGQTWFVNETIAAKDEHTLEGFLQFARTLGANKAVLDWDLALGEDDLAWASAHRPSGRVLAVNPAASKPERAWSVKKTIEVIEQAVERWQLSVVLTGGPTEYDHGLAQAIMAGCSKPIVNLVGKTKTKQLIAFYQQVDCLLCPDTGPAHMASAVKTPVIGLYAVNPPHISGPYLHRDLVVNRYPEAVREILGKDPKKVSWATRVHSPLAMDLIQPSDVMEQLALIFEKRQT